MAQALDLRTGSPRHIRTSASNAPGFRLTEIDFNRVAAEAGAIAINAAALLLLLAPLKPEFVPMAEETQEIFVLPLVANPPPPPVVAPIVSPRTAPAMTPIETPVRIEVPLPPVVEPIPGDTFVASEVVADASLDKPSIAQPQPGAQLEYLSAPPPTFPRDAIRDGLTGTVLLRVLVDVDGKPIEVLVERSSGHRILDLAAKRHVLSRWRFKPAMQDGQRVQAIGLVPIDFTLDR